MSTVGIDPGIHKGQPAATICIVDYPTIITHEHLTDFGKVCWLCNGADLLIIERPDMSLGFQRAAAMNLGRIENITGQLWGLTQGSCNEVLQVSATVIREYTCGWQKHRHVKADPFIKNWLMNLHFKAERQGSRPELFKPKGALSTDHKRDAYLAAWLAEMMLSSKMLASRVRAQSS